MPEGIQPAKARGIAMLTPTLGRVPAIWARRIYDIIWPMNTMKTILQAWDKNGGEVGEMRNYLVQSMLDNEARNPNVEIMKLFWLDDDVVPYSPAILQALLSHDAPVASGVYFCKGEFGQPLIFEGGCSGTGKFKPGEVFESWGYSQGLSLVDFSVYKRMKDELDIGVDKYGRPAWYKQPDFKADSNGVTMGGTEDFVFFENLSKLGIKPVVDCRPYAFGFHVNLADLQGYPAIQYDQWFKGEPVVWPDKGEQKEVVWQ